jgi:hypothetical protein
MGRPPMIPPEKKTRIVLAILAGEVSIAEAARATLPVAAKSNWGLRRRSQLWSTSSIEAALQPTKLFQCIGEGGCKVGLICCPTHLPGLTGLSGHQRPRSGAFRTVWAKLCCLCTGARSKGD